MTIPYAGSQEAKDRVKPLLTAMGGHALFDMGEQPGVPTVVKQLGNFLMISMGRSLSEGLAITESAGIDPTAAVNMLGESLFAIPIFRSLGKAFAEKRPMPASPIPSKDLGLFHRLAEEHGKADPITQTLLQLTCSPAK